VQDIIYCKVRKVSNAKEKVSNANEKVSNTFEKYLPLFKEAEITEKFIENSGRVFLESGVDKPFGQANIMEWLGCSKSKATNVMNAMKAPQQNNLAIPMLSFYNILKCKGNGSIV